MFAKTVVSLAMLASTAIAGSVGSAIVINACNYDVTLSNTPASGGGYDTIDKVLKSQDTYTQQWTELSNLQGWSLKLAKDSTLKNILQYEYTFHNDGIIWYDLSCVDGNPWDGNWEITASGDSGCSPKQQAYRYATDDAFGMQSCAADSSITVTLCSGESQNDGAASSVSASVASQSATAPAPVATSTSSTAASPTTTHPASYTRHWNQAEEAQTTLATSTTPATITEDDGNVVTVVETAVVTQYVESTPVAKRHEHHIGHPHARR